MHEHVLVHTTYTHSPLVPGVVVAVPDVVIVVPDVVVVVPGVVIVVSDVVVVVLGVHTPGSLSPIALTTTTDTSVTASSSTSTVVFVPFTFLCTIGPPLVVDTFTM